MQQIANLRIPGVVHSVCNGKARVSAGFSCVTQARACASAVSEVLVAVGEFADQSEQRQVHRNDDRADGNAEEADQDWFH